MKPRIPALIIALALVAAACGGSGTAPETSVAGTETPATAAAPATSSLAGTTPAYEFPAGVDWLNTEGPLTLSDLRGKVVILDFWTYGCINCIHIIPDLKRLEAEYPDELVVIGVHSAKFANEGETDNIGEVIQRYDLEHPVVNDRDFEIWSTWGARAWPTLVAIDPAGNIVGAHSGEGVYGLFKPVVESLVTEFDARGQIDRSPIAVRLESDSSPESVLSYPGKVLADPAGGRLFIADTNHHRIVIADITTGEVLDVAGQGEPGLEDGGFAAASFDQPQGMALSEDGSTLYVADTANHVVRALDLERRVVDTALGTGFQATTYPPNPGTAPGVSLASPWDVLVDGSSLYIAMAGSHQVWVLDLDGGFAAPVSGSGREGVTNGPSYGAELAQPSGLGLLGDLLFFADSESSSIRVADLANDQTDLVVGSDQDLFTFGDRDGTGSDALLQHPLGVAIGDGYVYVADTYNNKIKRIDPATNEIVTISGAERGWADGAGARYYEPGGLDFADGKLYVADTNNHVIRIVDPATGAAETLVLYGIERFEALGDGYRGTEVTLEPVRVTAGEVALVIDVSLPEGYKTNELAPFVMAWVVQGDIATMGAGSTREVLAPTFPVNATATFGAGSGSLTADLTIYYCTNEAEALCLIEQVRLKVPVEVGGSADTIVFRHEIPIPEL